MLMLTREVEERAIGLIERRTVYLAVGYMLCQGSFDRVSERDNMLSGAVRVVLDTSSVSRCM